MEAPLSVTLTSPSGQESKSTYPDVDLAVRPDDIFITAVGHSSYVAPCWGEKCWMDWDASEHREREC